MPQGVPGNVIREVDNSTGFLRSVLEGGMPILVGAEQRSAKYSSKRRSCLWEVEQLGMAGG